MRGSDPQSCLGIRITGAVREDRLLRPREENNERDAALQNSRQTIKLAEFMPRSCVFISTFICSKLSTGEGGGVTVAVRRLYGAPKMGELWEQGWPSRAPEESKQNTEGG